MIKTGSTENMYYTCTNHLGTINALVSSTGTIAEEYSTDAWGRRRNPTDWSYTNITTPALIYRSYTGHEHLDAFGLINMNARLYDPVIGRMLSPDNYLQDAANGQNYNRYTYVLNNPLKFTDPTGNEIDGGPWQKSVPAAYDNTAYWNAYSAVIDGIQEEIKRQSSERAGGGTIASLDEPEITFGYQTLQEVYIYANKPFMSGKKLDVHEYNNWKNAQGEGGTSSGDVMAGTLLLGGSTTGMPPAAAAILIVGSITAGAMYLHEKINGFGDPENWSYTYEPPSENPIHSPPKGNNPNNGNWNNKVIFGMGAVAAWRVYDKIKNHNKNTPGSTIPIDNTQTPLPIFYYKPK